MKAVVISEDINLNSKLNDFNFGAQLEILGIFPPGLAAMEAINKHNPELVLVAPEFATYMLREAQAKTPIRQYISASTHHGIQLLPVSAVYYFQAEHKYVIARHEKGELLINDSLISLEKEFSSLFIRIHRKILVAKQYIQALEKTEEGRWQILLTNYPDKLIVSRRQLSIVRKYINEYSSSQ